MMVGDGPAGAVEDKDPAGMEILCRNLGEDFRNVRKAGLTSHSGSKLKSVSLTVLR